MSSFGFTITFTITVELIISSHELYLHLRFKNSQKTFELNKKGNECKQTFAINKNN